MAFITYDSISAQLPNGHDSALAQKLLSNIEEDLKDRYKMEFVASSSFTAELPANSYSEMRLFQYWFIKSLTSVTLKDYEGNSSEVLTADEDYRLIEVPKVSGTYYAIELVNCYKNGVKYPYYLELVGQKGYQETVQTRIQNAIVDFLWRQLKLYTLDNTLTDRTITSARTGESQIAYGKSSNGRDQVYDSALDDPNFVKIIKRYLPPMP